MLSYIKGCSQEIATRFDELFSGEMESFATEMTSTFSILQKARNYTKQPGASEIDHNSVMILWSKANSLISAFELVRRGYIVEPLILARHALEGAAVVVDILKSPQKLSKFFSQKYKSTGAISVAKEVIPIFGKIYGGLSDNLVHIGLLSCMPQWGMGPNFGIQSLFLGGGIDENRIEDYVIVLCSLDLCTDVFNTIVEYSLFKFVDSPRFWRKKSETTLSFEPDDVIKDRHEERQRKLVEAFQKLMGRVEKQQEILSRIDGGNDSNTLLPG